MSKVNVFDNLDLAARYGISVVPQVHFFKQGDLPLERFVGFQSEQKLTQVMNQLLTDP